MSRAAPVSIRAGGPEDLPALRPLWEALYRLQREQGMRLRTPPDGFDRWAASQSAGLGRLSLLLIAEADGRAVGFLAGRVRLIPPWFGGGQAGFVSEVFVDESRRGEGIGTRLLDEAIAWFRQNGIRRVELQVLTQNTGARELYRRLGWTEELVQMVWDEPPDPVA